MATVTKSGARNSSTSQKGADKEGQFIALNRVMAVIEFSPDGVILNANENFCRTMGYALSEIVSKHHRQFVEPAYAASPVYAAFWSNLRKGEFVAAEFKRIAKGGREVWLQASYNPVFDSANRVVRVVKFATDITQAKLKAMDDQGQIEAVHRSNGVIEFSLDGTILSANRNFLDVTGYTLEGVRGKHHRMFVDPAYAASDAYRQFWQRLAAGEFVSDSFCRLRRDGRKVWIQATYNPIRDPDGRTIKIVKYATDITDMVERNAKLSETIDTSLNGIAENVSGVSAQASGVASAAEEASATIQNVAAAAEELNASISEISTSATASQQSAERARGVARSVDESTSALTHKAAQMSGIIKLIDDIASQINLLALNATIESARAGEAGRGFAVVASEVKQLAAQVSSATRTISTEIQGIQAVASDAAQGLSAIQSAVTEISDGISSVVSAVTQQSSATGEISRTMQAAAGAVADINRNIGSIAHASLGAADLAKSVRSDMKALVS